MHTETTEVPATPALTLPSPRHMSGEQLVILLGLLMELRDLTLSRATLRKTNDMIIDAGGADRLACNYFVIDDVE